MSISHHPYPSSAYSRVAEARCEAAEEREKAAKKRLLIPTTPTHTPELCLPVLSKEDRKRLAEEDKAFDERLIAILPLPAPAHRRSLSIDSSASEDDRFELRHMNTRSSQEYLLPRSPVAGVGLRSSVSRDSNLAGTSTEGLEQVAVISADASHTQ